MAAELSWIRSGLPTNYHVILDLRNECAVTSMSAPCEYAITPLYGINNRANNIKIVINTIIIGRPKRHFVLVASFCPFVGKNVANIGFYARK